MNIDKIVKTFTKAINQLETGISRNDDQLATNAGRVAEIEQENQDLVSENARAAKIRDNLKTLVNF